jgi:CRP/FNR family transcriptional regulator, cyclic AMP receptor protein
VASTARASAARRTARESTLPAVDELQFAQALTPKELETLEDMGEPGSFAAGETIFAEGESSDRVLLVRSGRVRVTARAPSGADVELAERGPGELLGDLSGIDGRPRSASVVATEDVAGLVVPLRAFRGFLMDHPRVAISLLELVSRRLRESDARRVAGS